MSQTFEWKQPIGGKTVLWRPLKVGDHMDLDANYARADVAHLRRFAAIAARITKIGDKEGVQVNDLRDWEEYDLVAFQDEFESRELARAVSLSPQRIGGSVVQLEQSIASAQLELGKVAQILQQVLQSAKQVEQKTGPLA